MLRRRLRDHTGRPLSLSEQEARALLAKYGTDDGGLLPYEVFCRALFAGASKLLAERGFRRG